MKSFGLKKLMQRPQNLLERQAELAAIAWMNRPSHPMPVFAYDDTVEVLNNGDWRAARVITSSKNGCQVQLIEERKPANLYDARCIRPA